jgi:hypothetical protein
MLFGLIQVGYKNFVGSMGASFVPFLVGDRIATPPDFASVCQSALTCTHAARAPSNGGMDALGASHGHGAHPLRQGAVLSLRFAPPHTDFAPPPESRLSNVRAFLGTDGHSLLVIIVGTVLEPLHP